MNRSLESIAISRRRRNRRGERDSASSSGEALPPGGAQSAQRRPSSPQVASDRARPPAAAAPEEVRRPPQEAEHPPGVPDVRRLGRNSAREPLEGPVEQPQGLVEGVPLGHATGQVGRPAKGGPQRIQAGAKGEEGLQGLRLPKDDPPGAPVAGEAAEDEGLQSTQPPATTPLHAGTGDPEQPPSLEEEQQAPPAPGRLAAAQDGPGGGEESLPLPFPEKGGKTAHYGPVHA